MIKSCKVLFAAIALSLIAFNAHAAIEYERICGSTGTFFYIPGTDSCLDRTTGEIKVQTAGGTWVSHLASRGNWASSAREGCKNGKLVKVGTFTANSLLVNSFDRYQTAAVPFTLGDGWFIAAVLMNGGFDKTVRGNVCLSFYDTSTSAFSILGCANTREMLDQQATWMFAPLRPLPPPAFTTPLNLIVATGDELWGIPPLVSNGSLTCWVCLQHVQIRAGERESPSRAH